MDFFRIPIGLVPRATTIQVCVKISVIATFLGRLLVLGTLLIGNSVICGKIFTDLNNEESELDISECLSVTMTESSSVSLYERCSWDNERNQVFKEEIINDIGRDKVDFDTGGGQVYCLGDKRLYIDNRMIFKEYDPNEAKPYKTLNEKENPWEIFNKNPPKKIYCGDNTFLINSRVFPISIWLGLFLLPFFLLTVLSNVSDLGFLKRHPEVLMFGNISHFQITPHNISGSDVKLYTMSASLTTLNVIISVLGLTATTIATWDVDLTLGSNSLSSSLWSFAGHIASMVPMIGLGMSLRFVCMGCCFPWKPAYSEETNSLHYMKDNQLLDNDDPCLTMTVRSRGVEITATLPPL